MFFAGKNRQATGRLGVHQFHSTSDDETAKIANVEYGSQFTVSEIIGYLNEFETPPFVFEKMFAQKQMYFFSDDELAKLNTAPTDAATIANFSKIDEFVVKAKEATKQAKAEAVEVETTVEVKDNDDLALRKQIQAELNRIGCTLGRVDGKIGPASKRALSRFNKLNKSDYVPDEFFNNSTRIELLKGFGKGACPKVMAVKKSTETIEPDLGNITSWHGRASCGWTIGNKPISMKILELQNGNLQMDSPFFKKPIKLKALKKNNKYSGDGHLSLNNRICDYRFSMDIDLNTGLLTGRVRPTDTFCLVTYPIKLLMLDFKECHFKLVKKIK